MIGQTPCSTEHSRGVQGNGILRGNGIPWDSHGNGNEKHISMGMGMISVGVGMSKNRCFKNSHLISGLSFINQGGQ